MVRIITKKQLFHPIVITSLLITTLWVFNDIASRVITTSSQLRTASTDAEKKPLPNMVLNVNERQFISKQYEHFKAEDEPETQTKEQLTQEQQLAQQGILKDVFVNDFKLNLKAVIIEHNDVVSNNTVLAYALIFKTNVKSGKAELVKVFNEEKLEGFTVKVLSSTQVELTRIHQNGEQNIILTMYRLANNSEQ